MPARSEAWTLCPARECWQGFWNVGNTVGTAGIEPATEVPKTSVIPFHYVPRTHGYGRGRTRTCMHTAGALQALAHSGKQRARRGRCQAGIVGFHCCLSLNLGRMAGIEPAETDPRLPQHKAARSVAQTGPPFPQNCGLMAGDGLPAERHSSDNEQDAARAARCSEPEATRYAPLPVRRARGSVLRSGSCEYSWTASLRSENRTFGFLPASYIS